MSSEPPPLAPEASAPPAARRVPWGFAVVGGVALVGIVLNFIGLARFPGNAPVEMVMAFGIGIDLLAAIVVAVVGLVIALVRPMSGPSRVFPWLGLGFAAVALIAWAVAAGGLFETLLAGGRGRYMNDTGGVFLFGIPWVLGAAFSVFGLRHPSTPARMLASVGGIVLWAIVVAGAVASSVLYGMGLTD